MYNGSYLFVYYERDAFTFIQRHDDEHYDADIANIHDIGGKKKTIWIGDEMIILCYVADKITIRDVATVFDQLADYVSLESSDSPELKKSPFFDD